MKWLHILYDTIWLRCHPITGGEDIPTIYPSWRAAWTVARGLHE